MNDQENLELTRPVFNQWADLGFKTETTFSYRKINSYSWTMLCGQKKKKNTALATKSNQSLWKLQRLYTGYLALGSGLHLYSSHSPSYSLLSVPQVGQKHPKDCCTCCLPCLECSVPRYFHSSFLISFRRLPVSPPWGRFSCPLSLYVSSFKNPFTQLYFSSSTHQYLNYIIIYLVICVYELSLAAVTKYQRLCRLK